MQTARTLNLIAAVMNQRTLRILALTVALIAEVSAQQLLQWGRGPLPLGAYR